MLPIEVQNWVCWVQIGVPSSLVLGMPRPQPPLLLLATWSLSPHLCAALLTDPVIAPLLSPERHEIARLLTVYKHLWKVKNRLKVSRQHLNFFVSCGILGFYALVTGTNSNIWASFMASLFITCKYPRRVSPVSSSTRVLYSLTYVHHVSGNDP